jgi:hypothetical protein
MERGLSLDPGRVAALSAISASRGALLPRLRPPLMSLISSLPPLLSVLVLLEGRVGGGDRVDVVLSGLWTKSPSGRRLLGGAGVVGGASPASPASLTSGALSRRCLRLPLPPMAMVWVVVLVAQLVRAAEWLVVRHGGYVF